jgi:hypothetical protein
MPTDLAFLTRFHCPEHHEVRYVKAQRRSRTEEARGSNPLTSTPPPSSSERRRCIIGGALVVAGGAWGHTGATPGPLAALAAAIATQAGSPESENEDWAGVAAPGLAVVLDGLSAPDGTGTGCRHGTPWFVSQLGPRLLTLAADPANSPADALAEAIRQVAGLHPGCDLTHPGTPFSHPGHAPRPGGGIWPDGAGMPDPQPHPPHQPTGTCAELGLSGAGDSRRAVPRLPARAGECWHGESSA